MPRKKCIDIVTTIFFPYRKIFFLGRKMILAIRANCVIAKKNIAARKKIF